MIRYHDKLFFSAHDIGESLNFIANRREVNELVLEKKDYHSKLINLVDEQEIYEGNDKLYVVDERFIIDLVLRAEHSIKKDFLIWLMNVIQEDNNAYYTKDREVTFKNSRSTRKTLFATTQIAKIFGMSASTLNDILHSKGVQYKINDQWILYNGNEGKGLTRTVDFEKANGDIVFHTYWTKQGVDFIINLLLDLGFERKEQLNLFN